MNLSTCNNNKTPQKVVKYEVLRSTTKQECDVEWKMKCCARLAFYLFVKGWRTAWACLVALGMGLGTGVGVGVGVGMGCWGVRARRRVGGLLDSC